jgi:hypothetical protein
MGTNYYLIRKVNYSKDTPSALGCDSCDNEVQQLSNGWVFENTYYSTLEELSKVYAQRIHIGKSSYGWHFSLCIYPEYGINNLEDWTRLFNDCNNQIFDEYDTPVSADTMLDLITNRMMSGWEDSPEAIKAFEERALIGHNNLMAYTCCGKQYETYDEFLADNHAVRGNKGLWKHQLDKFHVENPDKTATYDYIISGNDPEKGIIFS